MTTTVLCRCLGLIRIFNLSLVLLSAAETTISDRLSMITTWLRSTYLNDRFAYPLFCKKEQKVFASCSKVNDIVKIETICDICENFVGQFR